MTIGIYPVFLAIMDTIETFLQPYIDQVLGLLGGLPVWAQGAAILALGIFTIVGLVVFIKKFIKLFLVLAVLGVIVYFLWQQGIIQNLIDGLTGSAFYRFVLLATIGV